MRTGYVDSPPIEDIPSSTNPKENDHDRLETTCLPLPGLRWHRLHQRLPTAHGPKVLLLWCRLQMWPRLRLQQVLMRVACVAPNPSLLREPSGTSTNLEEPMKYLKHMLGRRVDCENGPDADERYRALSIDAQQFDDRMQALERRSP